MPLLYSKDISEELDISKIFAKVQHQYVKFDEEHDVAAPEPVDQQFSNYVKISCKNWSHCTCQERASTLSQEK